MARNMITGIETQKMQEYTQEQIDRAEHMGIAIPADVKEQIFEYANLVGEEEKVRTLVRNLADAVNRSDEDRVEELLEDRESVMNRPSTDSEIEEGKKRWDREILMIWPLLLA